MGMEFDIVLGWKGDIIVEKAKELHLDLNATNSTTFYSLPLTLKEELTTILKDTFSSFYPEDTETLQHLESTLTTVGELYKNESNPFSGAYFGVCLASKWKISLGIDFQTPIAEYDSFTLTDEILVFYQTVKKHIISAYPVFSDADLHFISYYG